MEFLTDLGSSYDSFSCVAIQLNGKIVAGGFNSSHILARYNPNGALDTSFRGSGIVSTSFSNFGFDFVYGGVSGLVIQPDGKIIGAGFWGLDGEFSVFALARYKGDLVGSAYTYLDADEAAVLGPYTFRAY